MSQYIVSLKGSTSYSSVSWVGDSSRRFEGYDTRQDRTSQFDERLPGRARRPRGSTASMSAEVFLHLTMKLTS